MLKCSSYPCENLIICGIWKINIILWRDAEHKYDMVNKYFKITSLKFSNYKEAKLFFEDEAKTIFNKKQLLLWGAVLITLEKKSIYFTSLAQL